MNKIDLLLADMEYLKLYGTMKLIENEITNNTINDEIIIFLIKMCSLEKAEKASNASQIVTKTANFPHLKRMNEFDFEFQPSINKMKITALCNLEFLNNNENIVLIGTPGVGKTHLATSIGLEAANKRISTYFIKCSKLLVNLKLAYEENRLDDRLKHYKKYKLLIIDEVGFLPISELESKILFQLIDLRYETRSTIFTSNLTLDKWHTIFGNINLSNAIVDRIVHHSHLFNINGTSFRLKDKLEKSDDT